MANALNSVADPRGTSRHRRAPAAPGELQALKVKWRSLAVLSLGRRGTSRHRRAPAAPGELQALALEWQVLAALSSPEAVGGSAGVSSPRYGGSERDVGRLSGAKRCQRVPGRPELQAPRERPVGELALRLLVHSFNVVPVWIAYERAVCAVLRPMPRRVQFRSASGDSGWDRPHAAWRCAPYRHCEDS